MSQGEGSELCLQDIPGPHPISQLAAPHLYPLYKTVSTGLL